jgi:hypothetical protein
MIRTLSIAVVYELVEGLDRLVHCNMPCSDIDHSSGCSHRTDSLDTAITILSDLERKLIATSSKYKALKQPKSRATPLSNAIAADASEAKQ